jgi:hypothetical protein
MADDKLAAVVATVQADLRSLEEQVDALDDRVEELEVTLDAELRAFREMALLIARLVETTTGDKMADIPPVPPLGPRGRARDG